MKTEAKVYRYGLVRIYKTDDNRADLEAQEAAIAHQIRAAHNYYNALIAVERDRRVQRNAIIAPIGDLPALQQQVDEAKARVEEISDEIKAWRSRNRKQRAPAESRNKLKAAKEARNVAVAAYRALHEQIRKDPAMQADLKVVDDQAKVASIQARTQARTVDGLYWGTYLTVEAAAKAACTTANPRFRRWRRSNPATLAVQFQKGVAPEALFRPNNKFYIEPTSDAQPRTLLHMRIGRDDRRRPLLATWRVTLHRPLPPDAVVKWAKVTRTFVARRECWALHLTVDVPVVPRKARGIAVAVDVGWRKIADGMRVAYYQGEDGREAPIMLDPPPDEHHQRKENYVPIMDRFRKVEDLQSIRKKRMNQVAKDLKVWMQGQILPDWFRQSCQYMHAWRSANRFAGLYFKWRDNRFLGDEDGYSLLKKWYVKDTHLWTWEANQRTRVQRFRRHWYREIAAELAKRYGTLIINDFDLRDTQKHAKLEAGKHEVDLVRWQQTKACCSELRTALKQAFWSRGGHVLQVPAAMVTRRCSVCGYDKPWKRPEELLHTCENPDPNVPRHTLDRDHNSTTNMLRMGAKDQIAKPIWPIKRKSRWAKVHEARREKKQARR